MTKGFDAAAWVRAVTAGEIQAVKVARALAVLARGDGIVQVSLNYIRKTMAPGIGCTGGAAVSAFDRLKRAGFVVQVEPSDRVEWRAAIYRLTIPVEQCARPVSQVPRYRVDRLGNLVRMGNAECADLDSAAA